MSYLYYHQRKGQVKVCMKFIKWLLKKCFNTTTDTFLFLLQVRSTSLGITLLFNCPKNGIMPVINRSPINTKNDDAHCGELVETQAKADKNYDTLKNL